MGAPFKGLDVEASGLMIARKKRKEEDKVMQRKKLLIGVLAIALIVSLASAALLDYYGKITGTITVGQAVMLDGKDVTDGSLDIIEELSGCDKILGPMHTLTTCSEIKKPLVKLNSTVTCPGGDCVGGEVDVYPEYRLDATWYDDAFFMELNDYITWQAFTGLSFGYYMEPGYPLEWIPQCNLVLRDGDGVAKYYASWHSFRTGINGTIGKQTDMTYEKAQFYFYELPDWGLLGLWTDLTPTQQAEINPYKFKYFVMQGGDTYTDPNTGAWEQIVWLYKFAVPTRAIKGIAIIKGYDAAHDVVEFRMVYDFAYNAWPGIYTIVTHVTPLGWMDP